MGSIVRRAFSHVVRLRSRSAIPSVLATAAQLYSRVFTTSELEVVRGNNISQQMTGAFAEGLPRGYVTGGLNIQAGSTVNRLSNRYVRSASDEFDAFRNTNQFISIVGSGAGGLDVGVRAPDTWYALYVISDSTRALQSIGMWSLNFTAPTMPAGYDTYRRLGCSRTGAASNLNNDLFFERHAGDPALTFVPTGQRLRRYYRAYNVPLVLTNGVATVFTPVSLALYAPPSAKQVLLEVRFAPGTLGAVTDEGQLRPSGATAADGPVSIRRGVSLTATQMITNVVTMPIVDQAVEYKVTQGGANQNTMSLRVLGYDDEV